MKFFVLFSLLFSSFYLSVNLFPQGYEGDAYYEEDATYDEEESEETPVEDEEDDTEKIPSEDSPTQTPPIVLSNDTNTPTVDPTIINKKKLILPVLTDYKPLSVVDPTNPELPANHQLKKIRGTIWKGNRRLLITNDYNIVKEQRLYLYFSENRDAIA
ncbi:MAG: hypothetical protein ACRCTJ_02160, partial [Brevinema sp.]